MADHRPKNQAESIDITGQLLRVGLFFRRSGRGRNPVLARAKKTNLDAGWSLS